MPVPALNQEIERVRACLYAVAVVLLSVGAADAAEPVNNVPKATASGKAAKAGKRVAVTYAKNGAKTHAAGTAPGAHAVKNATAAARGPDLKSASALVFDVNEDRVLYAKNVDQVSPIASITKLMTAIVVLDAGLPLDEPIRIERADVDTLKNTGSRLRIGSTFTRRDLLHLALMSSENRAASALGRNFPGGLEEFVTRMNARAAQLGMHSSHFVEPTGLSFGNVSTAEDLVLLVRASLDYPLIREFTTTRSAQVQTTNSKQVLGFGNSNGLVGNPKWHIDVSKTGYIAESGLCLVMHARITDRPVIIVLLDSWGKYTRIGDANRIKKWMETGAAFPARTS